MSVLASTPWLACFLFHVNAAACTPYGQQTPLSSAASPVYETVFGAELAFLKESGLDHKLAILLKKQGVRLPARQSQLCGLQFWHRYTGGIRLARSITFTDGMAVRPDSSTSSTPLS